MELGERESTDTEKGISIEACVEKADKYIQQNGVCLFVLDLKESRVDTSTSDRLDELLSDLSTALDEHLPENQLRTRSTVDKGFIRVLGDGILAGINDSQAITQSVNHIEEHYKDLSFHYNVAIDGYDEDGIRTIK